MVQDLTKGNTVKLLIKFSIPIIIGNIFQQVYNLADTLIVGKLIGVDALAAVGSTGSISFLVLSLVIGLAMGFAVVTGQYFGSGNMEKVRKSVAASIALGLGASIILTAVSVLLTRQMLSWMNTPSDIVDMAYDYLVVIFLGITASMIYNIASCVIQALGDSRIPLIFLIIASIINIVLDIVFVGFVGMGVAGAAWATVASQFISGISCFIYAYIKIPTLRIKKSDFKFSGKFAWEHLRVGTPMAIQQSVMAIGIVCVQAALNGLGTTAVAAYTAASKIDNLAIQVGISLGMASAAFSAQNFGAKQYNRIRIGIKKCLQMAFVVSVIGGILVVTVGYACVTFFVDSNQEAVELGRQYLLLNAPFYFFLAVLAIFRNSIQGMGNTTIPFIGSIVELVSRILVALLFTGWFGYVGVCLSSPIAWIATALFLASAYPFFIRKYPKEDLPVEKSIIE